MDGVSSASLSSVRLHVKEVSLLSVVTIAGELHTSEFIRQRGVRVELHATHLRP